MALITNWITATEVKDVAVKRNSFDTDIIEGNIGFSQWRYIKPALGDDFYNEINDEVVAASISADNTALLDNYLKKALAYFVLYESFYELENKVTTKGVMQDLSEFAQKPSGLEKENRRNDLLEKANVWLDHMQVYIKEAQEADNTKFTNYNSGTVDTAQDSYTHDYIPD